MNPYPLLEAIPEIEQSSNEAEEEKSMNDDADVRSWRVISGIIVEPVFDVPEVSDEDIDQLDEREIPEEGLQVCQRHI